LLIHRCARANDWVFGAIAELTDNSADAGAKNIRIDYLKGTVAQPARPMLRTVPWIGDALIIEDDGKGASRKQLQDMVRPYLSDKSNLLLSDPKKNIGRYGIGVKRYLLKI
jgi:hypothetical protein